MKKILFNYILPPIIYYLIRVWALTWRISNLNPELDRAIRNHPGRCIITSWHSRLFYLFYHFRGDSDWTFMISPSRDGDLMARLSGWMGYQVVRGSSYKNTLAGTRTLVKLLKQGRKSGIVADGSRGPRHQAQAGPIQIARITNSVLFPISCSADWKYEFKSWDRMVLPLPFSRCRFTCGPAITIPKDADDALIRQKQQELEDTLNRLTRECEAQ